MTTITNFLHTNFISSQAGISKNEQLQIPIWVINGTQNDKITTIKQYIISNCINNNKAIIHLDLGLSALKIMKNCNQLAVLQLDHGIYLLMPYQNKPYFLITLKSQARHNPSQTLLKLTKILQNILKRLQQSLIKINSKCEKPKAVSLLIQNLQIIPTLQTHSSQNTNSLQTFINHLPGLDMKVYKQITIFKNNCSFNKSEILTPQHEFVLERISTCLTDIHKYQSVNNTSIWTVISTVRRYTGYFNEQKYIIKITNNAKAKVQKWVQPKQQQTEAQKQMVSDLGFIVTKKQADKHQDIKHLIYPHLRVQQNKQKICQCNKKECKGCQMCQTAVRPQDEGLIILDDEQQDDDDIDV